MPVFSVAFYDHMLKNDQKNADEMEKAGCPHCGGNLHRHDRLRKAAGVPATLGDEHRMRFGFRCGRRGCRKRMSPESARFQGRKLYVCVVVSVCTGMRFGLTVGGAKLTAIGVSRWTLGRWKDWWQKRVPKTSFWQEKMASFREPVETKRLPASLLLPRVGEDLETQLTWLLKFIAPLGCDRAFARKAA